MTRKPLVKTYPNGLRAIYESPSKSTTITNIQVFCHVGSIHEPPELRGAAHFIEHMCFKGSRRFPSYGAVNLPFSQTASHFNAETTKQYTHYKVKCAEDHVAEFLTILGDALLHSKFDREEYKRELNVVREEVMMKTPNSFIESLIFAGTNYGEWADHKSYHKKGCLPYDKVVEFYHRHYIPQNMVLSIVSSIPAETIFRVLATKTAFGAVTRPSNQISPLLNLVPNCPSKSGRTFHAIHSSAGDVTRVEIGFAVCDQFNDADTYALNLLRHIIGCSMSSRLFIELREKRGLTYRSGAEMILYELGGVFAISAITDSKRLIRDGKSAGVLPVLFDMLKHLVEHGVTESEMKWAKHRIRESFQMEQLIGEDKCGYNGIRVMLHNESIDILTTAKMYEECYKSIDKKQVNAVIQKYFDLNRVYLSVVGGKLPAKSEIIQFLQH